jgi:HSP20 family protein
MTTCSTSTSTCAPEKVNALKPRYSVTNGKEAYEVRVELPGVRKESLHITLDESVLSLRAERKPTAAEGWKALHRELPDAGYALRLRLNMPVNEDALTAKLEDGILTLNVPIKEAAKPRLIAVQ